MASVNDRAQSAFGNQQDEATYRKAVKGKARFLRRFGDDTNAVYHLASAEVPVIGEALGVRNLVMGTAPLDLVADAAASPTPAPTMSAALPRRRSGSSPCATANKPHSLSRRNLPPRGRR